MNVQLRKAATRLEDRKARVHALASELAALWADPGHLKGGAPKAKQASLMKSLKKKEEIASDAATEAPETAPMNVEEQESGAEVRAPQQTISMDSCGAAIHEEFPAKCIS